MHVFTIFLKEEYKSIFLPFSHVCLNSGNGALGDFSRGKEFLSIRETKNNIKF